MRNCNTKPKVSPLVAPAPAPAPTPFLGRLVTHKHKEILALERPSDGRRMLIAATSEHGTLLGRRRAVDGLLSAEAN